VNEAQQKASRREETRVDKVPMRTINASEIRRFDPEGLSFFNMNSPADHVPTQSTTSITSVIDTTNTRQSEAGFELACKI
jgi:hypothetical protein